MRYTVDQISEDVILRHREYSFAEKALFMDTSFIELIDREKKKIEILRSKLEECRERLSALQSLSKSDDLDEVLFGSLEISSRKKLENTSPDVSISNQIKSKGDDSELPYPKRQLQDSVIDQLLFIGPNGKTLDEIHEYAVGQKNYHTSRETLNTFLNSYKKRYGFLDNYAYGHYRTTQRCYEFLENEGYLEKHHQYQQDAMADAMAEEEASSDLRSDDASVNAPEPGGYPGTESDS